MLQPALCVGSNLLVWDIRYHPETSNVANAYPGSPRSTLAALPITTTIVSESLSVIHLVSSSLPFTIVVDSKSQCALTPWDVLTTVFEILGSGLLVEKWKGLGADKKASAERARVARVTTTAKHQNSDVGALLRATPYTWGDLLGSRTLFRGLVKDAAALESERNSAVPTWSIKFERN